MRAFIVSSETISSITLTSVSNISLGSSVFKKIESSAMNLPEYENRQLHTSTDIALRRYKKRFSLFSLFCFEIP